MQIKRINPMHRDEGRCNHAAKGSHGYRIDK